MRNIWKPTPAQCAAIRHAACLEGRAKRVVIEPGIRCGNERTSMNILELTSDPVDWEGTDLFDYGKWEGFKAGVPLTEDGRAIVDFYVFEMRTQHRRDTELLGNVTVTYEGGRITRIHGYGNAAGNDYPLPEES